MLHRLWQLLLGLCHYSALACCYRTALHPHLQPVLWWTQSVLCSRYTSLCTWTLKRRPMGQLFSKQIHIDSKHVHPSRQCFFRIVCEEYCFWLWHVLLSCYYEFRLDRCGLRVWPENCHFVKVVNILSVWIFQQWDHSSYKQTSVSKTCCRQSHKTKHTILLRHFTTHLWHFVPTTHRPTSETRINHTVLPGFLISTCWWSILECSLRLTCLVYWHRKVCFIFNMPTFIHHPVLLWNQTLTAAFCGFSCIHIV